MVDREHPWIAGGIQKVKDAFDDKRRLTPAVLYVKMLDNPYTTPGEVQRDFKSCFSSPQPSKRHHGEKDAA